MYRIDSLRELIDKRRMDLEVIGEPETLRVGVLDCEQHVLRWHYSTLGNSSDAHWQTPTMFLEKAMYHSVHYY